MTLTKEWLLKTISELEEERDAIPGAVNEDAAMALAAMKLALASLEADSVANSGAEAVLFEYTGSGNFYGYGFYRDGVEVDVDITEPLYTAPPAPVVPDELLSAMEEVLRISDRDHDAWHKAKAGIVSCRAAMLQGKAEQPHSTQQTGWTGNGGADAALVMLDRIDTLDSDDDARIEDIKRIIRKLAGSPAEPARQHYKLPDDFEFDRFNDVVWLETVASNPHMHSPTTSTIAMVALELNRKLAAGNSPAIPDDVRRMDWLVSKTVDVREPMVYGSHSLFWSQTITDEEDDYHATKLREQIDAAMAAENAEAPQQEV